jgi:hypothetical protein
MVVDPSYGFAESGKSIASAKFLIIKGARSKGRARVFISGIRAFGTGTDVAAATVVG